MGKKAVRKLYKAGRNHSVVVTLPRDFLEELGLKEGDYVIIRLDKEKERIIITPLRE